MLNDSDSTTIWVYGVQPFWLYRPSTKLVWWDPVSLARRPDRARHPRPGCLDSCLHHWHFPRLIPRWPRRPLISDHTFMLGRLWRLLLADTPTNLCNPSISSTKLYPSRFPLISPNPWMASFLGHLAPSTWHEGLGPSALWVSTFQLCFEWGLFAWGFLLPLAFATIQ